jgi:hypothetical protein
MLCDSAATEGNDWMTDVVVMQKNGSRLMGEYDGYGRVDGAEIDWSGGEPQCYHHDCWEHAGKPEYDKGSGESQGSADQGWFFDDGEHDEDSPLGDNRKRADRPKPAKVHSTGKVPDTSGYGSERVIKLASGCEVSAPSGKQCDYLRIVDPVVGEIHYWDSAEWEEDPEFVMAAIVAAMTSDNED